MVHYPARVASIRDKAAGYLTRISNLEQRVNDPGFRKQLQHVRDTVDDVERFFLSQLDRENRSPQQEVRWLNYANMALAISELELNPLEDAVAKYGDKI
jgi:hypothetical protein